jgi:hypothetical protein
VYRLPLRITQVGWFSSLLYAHSLSSLPYPHFLILTSLCLLPYAYLLILTLCLHSLSSLFVFTLCLHSSLFIFTSLCSLFILTSLWPLPYDHVLIYIYIKRCLLSLFFYIYLLILSAWPQKWRSQKSLAGQRCDGIFICVKSCATFIVASLATRNRPWKYSLTCFEATSMSIELRDSPYLQHSTPSGARCEAVVISFGTTCTWTQSLAPTQSGLKLSKESGPQPRAYDLIYVRRLEIALILPSGSLEGRTPYRRISMTLCFWFR